MISINLIANSLALLAFVVAFYTLFARERKTPYITNYIFPPAAWMLIAIILVLLQQIVTWWRTGTAVTTSATQTAPLTRTESALLWAATACFYIGVFRILFNVWRLHNRNVNFRDDNLIKNLKIIRYFKNRRSWIRKTPPYEHNPAEIDSSALRNSLDSAGVKGTTEEQKIQTMAICGYPLNHSDKITTRLAAELIGKGWQVQYATCCRHPHEWVNAVKALTKEWAQHATQIAVVDGYTPHFGFTDSVHAVRTREVERERVSYVSTPESFAGVHTATAKAFNRLKSKSGTDVRLPTLIIYEGCRALVDLESVEQYRIFLRHVLTSERMWGGMVTLFVEPDTDPTSLAVISAYADYKDVMGTSGDKDAK
jgi:hypothetical protein